jgi:hypothetical protein
MPKINLMMAWYGAALIGIVVMNIPAVAGFSAPASFLCAYFIYGFGLRFAKKEWYVMHFN